MNILRNWNISVAFYCKFASFSSFFKKKTISFPKTHLFFSRKNLTFENFEKSYSVSRILQQFSCFYQFFYKKFFFSKKPIFLKHQIFELSEDFFYSVAFYCKFVAAILERIFFSDNASDLFSTKTYVLNSLRNFTISVAFYSKLTIFRIS